MCLYLQVDSLLIWRHWINCRHYLFIEMRGWCRSYSTCSTAAVRMAFRPWLEPRVSCITSVYVSLVLQPLRARSRFSSCLYRTVIKQLQWNRLGFVSCGMKSTGSTLSPQAELQRKHIVLTEELCRAKRQLFCSLENLLFILFTIHIPGILNDSIALELIRS